MVLEVQRFGRVQPGRQQYGYFAGVKIDPRPPLVWLVVPGLRFHSATDTLRKYLSSQIRGYADGPFRELAQRTANYFPTVNRITSG